MLYLLTFAIGIPAVYGVVRLIIHSMDHEIHEEWNQEAPSKVPLRERVAFQSSTKTEANLYQVRGAAL